MSKIKQCYKIARPITSTNSMETMQSEGKLKLRLQYQREFELIEFYCHFNKVRAYRFNSDYYCSDFELENADCTLIEILNSKWIKILKKQSILGKSDDWIMKHYMLYFPEEGCIEVIAENWELVYEKQIN